MDNATPQKQVVLGIIQNAQGKVLIISRVHPEKTSEGEILTWAFPGGNVLAGETSEQALARELREETGYQTKVEEQISERDFAGLPVHLKYYKCTIEKVKTTVIEETHEIDKIKWVDPNLLKKYFTTNLDSKVAAYLGI